MPTVFIEDGYRVFFFSSEGTPLEPIHAHVQKASGVAKFWLLPNVSCVNSRGFSSGDLKRIQSIPERRRDEVVTRWNEYFGID